MEHSYLVPLTHVNGADFVNDSEDDKVEDDCSSDIYHETELYLSDSTLGLSEFDWALPLSLDDDQDDDDNDDFSKDDLISVTNWSSYRKKKSKLSFPKKESDASQNVKKSNTMKAYNLLLRSIHNRRRRPFLFAAIVFMILLLAFMVNAILIIINVMDAYKNPFDMKIHSIRFSNLCADEVVIRAQANLRNPSLADFILQKGHIKLLVNGEDMIHIPINDMILFPSGRITRVDLESSIIVTDRVVRKTLEMIRNDRFHEIKFDIARSFKIKTNAFWFPIELPYQPDNIDPFGGKRKDINGGGLGVHSLDIVDSGDSLHANFSVQTVGDYIANYFILDIPDMSFDLVRTLSDGTTFVVGGMVVKSHTFSTDRKQGKPLKATFHLLQDRHLSNLQQHVVTDFLKKRNMTFDFVPTPYYRKCKIATWISSFGIDLYKNPKAGKTKGIKEMLSIDFDAIHRSTSHEVQLEAALSFQADTLNSMFSASNHSVAITVKTPPIHLNLFYKRKQDTDFRKMLLSLQIEHKPSLTDKLRFQARLKISEDTLLAHVNGDIHSLLIVGDKNSSMISKLFRYQMDLTASAINAELIGDDHFAPESNCICQYLDLIVDTNLSSTTLSLKWTPPQIPIFDGIIIRTNWPKLNVIVAFQDLAVALNLEINPGFIRYSMTKQTLVNSFSGEPLLAKIIMQESPKFALETLINRIGTESDLIISIEMNGMKIKMGYALRKLRSMIISLLKGKSESRYPEKQGIRSPLSKALAFQGLEVLGLDANSFYGALMLISHLNVRVLTDPKIKEPETVVKRSIKIHTTIMLPQISFVIERKDDSVIGQFLTLSLSQSTLKATSEIRPDWELYTNISTLSSPNWNSFNESTLPNSIPFVLSVTDSDIWWWTLADTFYYHEANKANGSSGTGDQGSVIKLFVDVQSESFKDMNHFNRLVSYVINWILQDKPVFYFVAGSQGEMSGHKISNLPESSESASIDLNVDSSSLKEMLLNINFTLPQNVYDPVLNATSYSNPPSEHLAEKFLFQWGNFHIKFFSEGEGDQSVLLAESWIQEGRVALNLGRNKIFSVAFNEIVSTLSRSFSLTIRINGHEKLGVHDVFTSYFRSVFRRGEGKLEISGRNDRFLNRNVVWNFRLNQFNFRNLHEIIAARKQGASYFTGSEFPSFPDSFSEYIEISAFDKATSVSQTFPCLLLTSCVPGDDNLQPGFDIDISVKVRYLGDFIMWKMQKLMSRFLMYSSVSRRPKSLSLSLKVSEFTFSFAINGVPLFDIKSQKLSVILNSDNGLIWPQSMDWRLNDPIVHKVIFSIPRDRKSIQLLMKNHEFNRKFVGRNFHHRPLQYFGSLMLSLQQSPEINILGQMVILFLDKQEIDLTRYFSGEKVAANGSDFQLVRTSLEKAVLQKTISYSQNGLIPAISIKPISIEIYFDKIKVVEAEIVNKLWEIQVICTYFNNQSISNASQVFEEFIHRYLLRTNPMILDVRVKAKEHDNLLADTQVFLPVLDTAPDFLASESQTGYSWRLIFNNTLNWDLYLAKMEIELYQWIPLQGIYSADAERTELIGVYGNPASWSGYPKNITADSILIMGPRETKPFEIYYSSLVQTVGSRAALKGLYSRTWRCLQSRGLMIMAFKHEDDPPFYIDVRIKLTFMGSKANCLAPRLAKCFPMLSSEAIESSEFQFNEIREMYELSFPVSLYLGFRVTFTAVYGNESGRICFDFESHEYYFDRELCLNEKSVLPPGLLGADFNVTLWYFPSRSFLYASMEANGTILRKVSIPTESAIVSYSYDSASIVIESLGFVPKGLASIQYVRPRQDSSRLSLLDDHPVEFDGKDNLDQRPTVISLRIELNDTCGMPYHYGLHREFSAEWSPLGLESSLNSGSSDYKSYNLQVIDQAFDTNNDLLSLTLSTQDSSPIACGRYVLKILPDSHELYGFMDGFDVGQFYITCTYE